MACSTFPTKRVENIETRVMMKTTRAKVARVSPVRPLRASGYEADVRGPGVRGTLEPPRADGPDANGQARERVRSARAHDPLDEPRRAVGEQRRPEHG